jgi:general secretion pathway protein K
MTKLIAAGAMTKPIAAGAMTKVIAAGAMKPHFTAAKRRASPRPPRGAALLLAMVLLVLVATLAAGMVWQQWRAVQVEVAERSRIQAAWILDGALGWARLILREDARSGGADHLGEPWAMPLAEARLSSFLAADRDHNADDSGIEAFLSGAIVDAQSHYNLRHLVAEGELVKEQQAVLQRLCESAGLASDLAGRLADGLLAAWTGAGDTAPLAPQTVAQLTWIGVSASEVAQLQPLVEILPTLTSVNVNTAPREVLAAVLGDLGAGSVERLMTNRQSHPFTDLATLQHFLPDGFVIDKSQIDIRTDYFTVGGRIRIDDRVVQARTLVRRNGQDVIALRREAAAAVVAPQ